jgi:hypothetical protein
MKFFGVIDKEIPPSRYFQVSKSVCILEFLRVDLCCTLKDEQDLNTSKKKGIPGKRKWCRKIYGCGIVSSVFQSQCIDWFNYRNNTGSCIASSLLPARC